ncbi:MAG: hypothetical protein ABI461_23770 [Polyangiaceae bacterium]
MASPNWPGRSRIVFGTLDLLASALIAIGVFLGLPARWMPVDVCAGLLIVLLAGAGFGLLRNTEWSEPLARLASRIVLAFALLLFALVSSSVSYLYGIYGAVGRGGATLFILVAALAFPYLFVLPVIELLWLGPHRTGKQTQ